jgi:hypothetical protein
VDLTLVSISSSAFFIFSKKVKISIYLIVLYTGKRVCDVALIKRTLSSGKPKKGWEFGGEGTRE